MTDDERALLRIRTLRADAYRCAVCSCRTSRIAMFHDVARAMCEFHAANPERRKPKYGHS